jgi:DNA invertase Pin-like site-specific DNA recombinase
VQELRRQGLGATDIARQMHIGRSTVYTILHSGQRDEPEDAP